MIPLTWEFSTQIKSMCFILCSMWCHHDIQWCSHNVFVIVIIVRINLYICMHHHHERNLTHPTTYSRKFWLYKIVQKCLETLKKKFSWLLFSLNKHAMFRPHPYQLIATPHMQTCQLEETIKRISKHVQQWPSLLFVWRPPRLWKYLDFSHWRKLPPWTEGVITTDLDFDSFGVSLKVSLAINLYSSRLILLYRGADRL